MKLHNTFTNNECIGKMVTAQPGLNRSWITYSEGNNGEENYYRDAYINGILAYCYGEECKIKSYDEERNIITMSNDNLDDDNISIFNISYKQYIADFGTQW